MKESDKNTKREEPSEEYVQFEAAMKRILKVRKEGCPEEANEEGHSTKKP